MEGCQRKSWKKVKAGRWIYKEMENGSDTRKNFEIRQWCPSTKSLFHLKRFRPLYFEGLKVDAIWLRVESPSIISPLTKTVQSVESA